MPERFKLVLCGIKSPLGAFAEWAVGKAQECWCCSFWRGVAWGAGLGAVVSGGGLGALL